MCRRCSADRENPSATPRIDKLGLNFAVEDVPVKSGGAEEIIAPLSAAAGSAQDLPDLRRQVIELERFLQQESCLGELFLAPNPKFPSVYPDM